MIPDTPSTTQPPSSPAVATLVPCPATDPPGGADACPLCGRAYFGPAASQLLDLVVLTHEQLGKVKAMLEEVVVP
jgi:hypothetical protein